jgi:hypothetical protein
MNFAIFFTNIGLKYANDIPGSKYTSDSYLRNKSKLNMFLTPTDPYEVVRQIDSLKHKHSSRHDGLSSSLIKDIKHEIALPLTILINKSLSTGIVPDLLKTAKSFQFTKQKIKSY